jgi:hypothetical protein
MTHNIKTHLNAMALLQSISKVNVDWLCKVPETTGIKTCSFILMRDACRDLNVVAVTLSVLCLQFGN